MSNNCSATKEGTQSDGRTRGGGRERGFPSHHLQRRSDRVANGDSGTCITAEKRSQRKTTERGREGRGAMEGRIGGGGRYRERKSGRREGNGNQ